MTEAQWFSCTEPDIMVAFLRGKVSYRKFRLFAVSCCRRLDRLTDPVSQYALEVAERYADGLASEEELRLAHFAARNIANEAIHCPSNRHLDPAAALAAAFTAKGQKVMFSGILCNCQFSAGNAIGRDGNQEAAWAAERVAQCGLLHEVFGNPFHPVSMLPAWLPPPSAASAASIYDQRLFDRLPELAASLEAAGCTNAELLGHLRGPGPHVRGCWAVDLLLGKS
jgi:hypothetical protein